MKPVSLDVRVGSEPPRAVRFEGSHTVDDMIRHIVTSLELVTRDDYVLYVPPTDSAAGKWLQKSDTLLFVASEAKGVAIELHRSPLAVLVHLSPDGDLSPDTVQNNVHYTKRVPIDVYAPIADALRDWRAVFSPPSAASGSSSLRARSSPAPARDPLLVRVWRPGAPQNTDRTEWLTLAHSLVEQGVEHNETLLLFPLALAMRAMTVKSALSAALFTGYLHKATLKAQPQSAVASLRKAAPAAASSPSLIATPNAATIRQSASKKPYFFVLRSSCLMAFKSDVKTDKLHKVMLCDDYRFTKVALDATCFALRLDPKENGTGLPVVLLHTQHEKDIAMWMQTIVLMQRAPTAVLGVPMRRVAARSHNRNQYCPDYLAALVGELCARMGTGLQRWRCLAAGDARPPAELGRAVCSDRLPSLSQQPDTACAAALRQYLSALPEPIVAPVMYAALHLAARVDDTATAASVLARWPDAVQRTALSRVLELLALVPRDALGPVAELFVPCLCGDRVAAVWGAADARETLAWLLMRAAEVLDRTRATVDVSDVMARATTLVQQMHAQQQQQHNESGADTDAIPLSPTAQGSATPFSPASPTFASAAPPSMMSPSITSAAMPSAAAEKPLLSPVMSPRRPPPPSAPSEVLMRAAYRFDARAARELSVAAGDVVRVTHSTPSGWSAVTRVADDQSGLVPTSYLAPIGAANVGARASADRDSAGAFGTLTAPATGERLMARYVAFEAGAVEAIAEERRAKMQLLRALEQLERRAM